MVDLVVLFIFAIIFLILLFMASEVATTQEGINQKSGYQDTEMIMISLMNYPVVNNNLFNGSFSEFLRQAGNYLNYSDTSCPFCFINQEYYEVIDGTIKNFTEDLKPFNYYKFMLLREDSDIRSPIEPIIYNYFLETKTIVYHGSSDTRMYESISTFCNNQMILLKTLSELDVPLRTAKIPIIYEGKESNLEVVLCYVK